MKAIIAASTLKLAAVLTRRSRTRIVESRTDVP
jgi:hypothetical protein